MKNPSLLTVVKVSEVLLDKNDKEYKKISVQTSSEKEIVDDSTGEVIKMRVAPRESSFTAYKESYLPGNKMQFGWDFKIGAKVAGDIVKKKVEAYTIQKEDGSITEPLHIASVIVLGEDIADNWENLVQAAFKNKDFILVGSTENKNPAVIAAKVSAQKNLVEA